MPFGSFQGQARAGLRRAVTLIRPAAQMVKIEGGAEMAPTVEFMVRRGCPCVRNRL